MSSQMIKDLWKLHDDHSRQASIALSSATEYQKLAMKRAKAAEDHAAMAHNIRIKIANAERLPGIE